MSDVTWPTHAYVPGKTTRHPEGAFDKVRATARAGMPPPELANCDAFRFGLRYIDGGYYWEAHELLEPVWMALPDPSVERRLVQGLIQIANGYLKLEMERPKAALRLAHIARNLVPRQNGRHLISLDVADLHRRIDSLEELANCAI